MVARDDLSKADSIPFEDILGEALFLPNRMIERQ
jgi:hypothetical protein